MALPQRRDPNEERRIHDLERRRIENEPPATAGGFGWWWLWLLIIIAIIWFAGWGWGGYGGWWWGRRGAAPVATTGNVNGTGTATGTNATGANAAVLPSGEGVAILNAANKRTFIGQRVDIRDVRVDNKVNDRALWIGNTNGNSGNNGGGNAAGANAGTNGAAGNSGAAGAANAPEVPTLVVLEGAANANNGGNAKNKTPANTVNGNLNDINNGQAVNITGTVEKAPPASVAQKQWGLDHGAAQRLEKDGAYIRATQVSTANAQQ